ncbi:hypothetical protein H0G86_006159 [Trichoderma simmonsii]|uniref:Uncharacterized protein n=1 Tax=Trichoderma simmonsii TaxID=1491479 RepID=A0A8G0LDV7_9HYPO|nr:hypothetical protein H0G86_006159 [Trichoderma simmonsii]
MKNPLISNIKSLILNPSSTIGPCEIAPPCRHTNRQPNFSRHQPSDRLANFLAQGKSTASWKACRAMFRKKNPSNIARPSNALLPHGHSIPPEALTIIHNNLFAI